MLPGMRKGLRRWGAFQREAVLIAGSRGLALASAVTVVVGGSVGALAAWLAGVSWLLAALAALASLFVFYTAGAYKLWDGTDRRALAAESALAQAHEALAKAGAKSSFVDQSVKFWDVRGGVVAGNEIRNISNPPPPGAGMPSVKLIDIQSGGITGSEATVEFGDGAPVALPDPLPSTPDERIGLRDQMLALADKVETVMATWAQPAQDVAAQMGIPLDEFQARVNDILAERSRIDDAATARYNAECRSAVIQVYSHARSIGFADAEMERPYRSRLGAVASGIPEHLRRVAALIRD